MSVSVDFYNGESEQKLIIYLNISSWKSFNKEAIKFNLNKLFLVVLNYVLIIIY